MLKNLLFLSCLIILFCGNTSISNEDSFSIIILPDTQYYSLRDGTSNFPETYKMQTQWIADHSNDENIQFVVHMGDMTHRNTLEEWLVADAAHDILDNAGVPYSVMPGNHDYPGNGNLDTASLELYTQYFGPHRFQNTSWYGGLSDATNANNYSTFIYNSYKFLIISFEFAPSKEVLCWADQLISSHPDYNVILVTHCYLRSNTTYTQNCNTAYNVTGSSGDDIWNELARRHSNVLFVLSGHIGNSGYRVKTGNGGNCVHEILTDYQLEEWPDVGGSNYGNGWMRKMTFTPTIGTVDVESFSVIPGVDMFNQGAYNSDPEHQDHKYTIQDTYLEPTYSRSQLSNTFNDLAVNVTSSGDQLKGEVASASNGDFVVVWEDDNDDNGYYQIYARGFTVDGCQKFATRTINQIATGQQIKPHIDMNTAGDFVIVWEDDIDDDANYVIKAAGFDQFGNRRFNDLTVNANLNGQHLNPRVGIKDDGNFMVVWQDDADANNYYQIYAAGYNNNATVKIVPDFTVNQTASGQQLLPDIAVSPLGKYIISWEDDADGNGQYQIRAAGFQADSDNRLFDDFTVNDISLGQQLKVKVAIDQNENFTLVWEDDNNNDGIFQILGAHFTISGQQVGSDFTVKADQVGQLKNPDISKNENGDFVVSWQDDSDGNTFFEIAARGFSSTNGVLFDERTINEDGSAMQLRPTVAFSYGNNYTIVWEDDLDQDDNWQILANGHDIMETAPPSNSCNPSCRQILHFSASQNIDSLYEASVKINSSSQINSNVTYSAGHCITLKSGFTVNINNTFIAKIDGCN